MFDTFELQNLNKLVEGKVGDFASPEPFHTVKIKSFGGDGIKPSAEVRGKFPMPISALVGNLPIQSCDLPHSTIPIARPFDFTRKAFVVFAKCFQGLLQRLRVLDFLTRVERQIGLQTEIYPYTLTCRRIRFGCRVVRNNIEPIRADRITKDLEITDVSMPLTVLMEREPTFLKLQRLCGFVPLFKRQADTVVLNLVCTLKLRRTVAPLPFELRQATKPLKKNADRSYLYE